MENKKETLLFADNKGNYKEFPCIVSPAGLYQLSVKDYCELSECFPGDFFVCFDCAVQVGDLNSAGYVWLVRFWIDHTVLAERKVMGA